MQWVCRNRVSQLRVTALPTGISSVEFLRGLIGRTEREVEGAKPEASPQRAKR